MPYACAVQALDGQTHIKNDLSCDVTLRRVGARLIHAVVKTGVVGRDYCSRSGAMTRDMSARVSRMSSSTWYSSVVKA